MMRFTALIIISTLLASPAGAQAAIRDSAGVRIVTNPISVTLPVYRRVVQPESVTLGISRRRKELFGSVVGALRLSDGTIVVADGFGPTLRLFTSNGHLTRLIGHKGDGPGDFQEIVRLQRLPGDTIVTWDRQSHRVTLFAPNGKLFGTTSIDLPAIVQKSSSGPGVSQPLVAGVGRFADGRGLATSGHSRSTSGTHLYSDSLTVWLVGKGGAIERLGEHFAGESYVYQATSPPQVMIRGKLPFGPNGSIAVGPRSWYYSNGTDFEIQERSPAGVLLSVFRTRRRRVSVSENEAQAYRDAEVADAPKKYKKFQTEV